MSRVDAPELEDLPAFPAPLRDAMTGFLRVGSEVLGVSAAAAPLVREALAAGRTDRIVDLCSGGGGPVLSVLRRLEREDGTRVEATLTDLYPNTAAFTRAEAALPGRVHGRRAPTDATRVPSELAGVRTIFNAFHHLPPQVARAVLADAAAQRQPILTFEIVERSAQGWLLVASLPAAVYGLLPFVRPVDARALALTYGLPVVPAAVLWDGFASCLRAYSPVELEDLVGPLQRDDYRFRIERRRIPWRPLWVTSVVGLPR
ncbi:MAG: hypothetical protein IT376_18210 [Polyangiaceae bacterium]|nr:hypothetical protein [Polyangiaceae bacterium]